MRTFTVAIVGTGPHPEVDSHEGYSMGYRHADGYVAAAGCELVGCADVVADNADAFVAEYDLDPDAAFTDHERMLDTVEPDVVSVCTPPSTHPGIVADCAGHAAVTAVHCEKPMATTFGESRRMVEVCEEEDVQLTINVQNRCSRLSDRVKELVDDGAIGDLQRVEIGRHDLLQTGIHHVDLANFVAGDPDVEWVIGQIDYPEEKVWYTDMHAEHQSVATWGYENGVHGFASTGEAQEIVGRSTNRYRGTEGEIELGLGYHEARIRTYDGGGWEELDVEDPAPQDRAIQFVIEGLESRESPRHSGDIGLAATEIVFGVWESARRRGRVDLPLRIDDNPLESMVESGDLPPDV